MASEDCISVITESYRVLALRRLRHGSGMQRPMPRSGYKWERLDNGGGGLLSLHALQSRPSNPRFRDQRAIFVNGFRHFAKNAAMSRQAQFEQEMRKFCKEPHESEDERVAAKAIAEAVVPLDLNPRIAGGAYCGTTSDDSHLFVPPPRAQGKSVAKRIGEWSVL